MEEKKIFENNKNIIIFKVFQQVNIFFSFNLNMNILYN
jgi:hypothetical protein